MPSKICKILALAPEELKDYSLVRHSVDARKKSQLHYTITVDLSLCDEKREAELLKHPPSKRLTATPIQDYHFPPVNCRPKAPVIVGMGPCGLFAALFLARAGVPSLVLERGAPVEERAKLVQDFWTTGVLSPQSNVQFGEGGAGTFSDGKLSTGTKDPRQQALFQTLVEAGAPPDILYRHKPHIGTDVLQKVLKNIRAELISLGCDLRFGHRLLDFSATGDRLHSITVESEEGQYQLPCSHLVLAVGHSARDVFTLLQEKGVPLAQKNFAVGVRMEHLQSQLSFAQYGPDFEKLPPSDYKLSCHLPGGRSLFSFCVCPGGEVVGATSAEGHLVTNGMSYRSRSGKNINGGLLVGVDSQDFAPFGGDHPLAGMYFQEHWERIAFEQGGGDYRATCQRWGDFRRDCPSAAAGEILPSYRPGVRFGQVSHSLPPPVSVALGEGIPVLGRKIAGFDREDALLTAIETRSSSPVRILRDQGLESALRGLYPCGEGAGYAGGIVSAAVDGIRVAERLVSQD